jgi:hypothetical protein
LSSGNWINLGSPVTATDSITNAPQRFYHLVLTQ